MLSVSEVKLWQDTAQGIREKQDQPQEVIKLVYRLWLEAEDEELPIGEDHLGRPFIVQLGYARRISGLCPFMSLVLTHANLSVGTMSAAEAQHRKLLIKGLGATGYPFGASDYFHRQANCTQHLCPNRVAWVKHILAGHQPEDFDRGSISND